MARPLSVASVIDKNKLASDNAWLIFLDIGVVDPNTRLLVETLRVVRNDEATVFGGEIYSPANFGFSFNQASGEEPSVTLTIQDQTTYISERIDAYSGGANFTVTLTIANSARLDQAPELQEEFRVNSITHKNYVITAMLGSENLLAMRYPPTTQFQDRCRFRYKGPRCKYAGAMSSCDYTRSGDNGCEAHNNVVNFGGFSGLRPLNI